MTQRRVYIYLVIAALLVAISIGLRFLSSSFDKTSQDGVTVIDKGGWRIEGAAPPSVGGSFKLVDHEGQSVSDADFRGTNMLVFFGYTNCPDVCPLTLENLSRGLALLGEDAGKIQPLFISLDPIRDTPDVIKDYLQNFDERIIGLTGTLKQVSAVQRAYSIFMQKREGDAENTSDYLVDHTSITYMMGVKGEFKTFFSNGSSAQEFAAKIRKNL